VNVIVVHGGVTLSKRKHREKLDGIRKAVEAGFEVLKSGGTSLDAVEAAVKVLEDDPNFNAGLGSQLNQQGYVEMDASVMDGKTMRAGGVALVSNVKNPVSLARLVMEQTKHVLLAGYEAELLAKQFGLELKYPCAVSSVERYLKLLERAETTLELVEVEAYGTVGAVALDEDGNVAAATSTGGLALKLPGRIGDSAIVGCGTYADNRGGACSGTGIGEAAMITCAAFNVVRHMAEGRSPMEACKLVVDGITKLLGKRYGVIAVNPQGEVGIYHSTEYMYYGYMKAGFDKPIVRDKL